MIFLMLSYWPDEGQGSVKDTFPPSSQVQGPLLTSVKREKSFVIPSSQSKTPK